MMAESVGLPCGPGLTASPFHSAASFALLVPARHKLLCRSLPWELSIGECGTRTHSSVFSGVQFSKLLPYQFGATLQKKIILALYHLSRPEILEQLPWPILLYSPPSLAHRHIRLRLIEWLQHHLPV